MKQTSSKHQAIVKQTFSTGPYTRNDEANLEHTSCTCIGLLNTFASCLLNRVNGV